MQRQESDSLRVDTSPRATADNHRTSSLAVEQALPANLEGELSARMQQQLVIGSTSHSNAKNQLQEWCMAKRLPLPGYKTVPSTEGTTGWRAFCTLYGVDKQELTESTTAVDSNKKAAEMQAAQLMLNKVLLSAAV